MKKPDYNRIFRFTGRIIGFAVVVILTATFASAASSQIDQTFGTNGKSVWNNYPGAVNGGVRDIAIRPDGKIITAGTANSRSFVIFRYNANGTLDNTFGTGGFVIPTFGYVSYGNAVVLQSDGKITAAGYSYNGELGGRGFAFARYNSDGTLDTSFGYLGRVWLTTIGSQEIRDIAIQPDGKIIAVGNTDPNTGNMILRLNADGSLDTTFNNTGYTTIPVELNSVAIQLDGKIIGAGTNGLQYTLARYNPNGSPDNSFGANGIVTTIIGNNSSIVKVLVQPNGKIVACGGTDGDFSAARYNSDGSLDTSFDSDGKVVVSAGNNEIITSALLQPDGKIVIGGHEYTSLEVIVPEVIRLNPNGSLDNSFHGDGKYRFPDSINFILFSSAIQADGKLVFGGQDGYNLNHFVLTRLLGDSRAVVTDNTPIIPQDRGGNPPTTVRSTINISDLNGAITKVRVTLNNVTHTRPADLDILLESPTGVKTMIASDTISNGSGVTDFNFTFDQTALAASLPLNNTGFYQPTNAAGNPLLEPNGIDNLPFPGPGSQNYGAPNLDVFNGTNPNGTWKLYVADDEQGNTGRIGSWTLDVTATTSRLNNLTADFDGDGKTDLSIFRPSLNQWWFRQSSDNVGRAFTFASNGDKIVPADYTGDGKTDIAVFTPSNGFWRILRSEDSTFYGFPFASPGDIPAPGDYDGDGKADAAVFNPSTSVWYISKSTGGVTIQPFGISGDVPVVADYDGDSKADIAIYRPSLGQWWYLRSSDGGNRAFQFGASTDKPVQGDYTGDGKADLAFFRPETRYFYILRSEDSTFYGFPFASPGDIPVSGDYDGDGKFDVAVFNPSQNNWYVYGSTAGITINGFGSNGDQPVPNAFVP